MQYEIVIKVIGCSFYTCLPRTAPAAVQTGQKTAAPGTVTGAPPVARRLLTNTWPKRGTTISIQANSTSIHKNSTLTSLKLFYALQRSRGYKERLKRS